MSKKKTTWADVRDGDTVKLNGREWLVVEIDRGKKKATVLLALGKRNTSARRPIDERVKVTGHKKPLPVHDRAGSQTRWATDAEVRRELGENLRASLPRGSGKKKPPAPADGPKWSKPAADGAERTIVDLLHARLVAETPDEEAGYYVPPVDVSTIAMHLLTFHHYTPPADEGEASMLAYHAKKHELALKGEPLPVTHWHDPKRPRVGSEGRL